MPAENHTVGLQNAHIDFYQKLRQRIQDWAESEKGQTYRWARWILLAPDLFHLVVRLTVDPEVPFADKGKLAAVVAYFISPLDLLPELILGPTGFLDDVILTVYALNTIINHVDPMILRKHWAGDGDILILIQNILSLADQALGSGLFRRLKKALRS